MNQSIHELMNELRDELGALKPDDSFTVHYQTQRAYGARRENAELVPCIIHRLNDENGRYWVKRTYFAEHLLDDIPSLATEALVEVPRNEYREAREELGVYRNPKNNMYTCCPDLEQLMASYTI